MSIENMMKAEPGLWAIASVAGNFYAVEVVAWEKSADKVEVDGAKFDADKLVPWGVNVDAVREIPNVVWIEKGTQEQVVAGYEEFMRRNSIERDDVEH